jgi:DNA-binding response OmpR family regulator
LPYRNFAVDVRLDLGTLAVERAGRPIKPAQMPASVAHPDAVPDPRIHARRTRARSGATSCRARYTLRAHVYTLRKALNQPGETELVETIHGIGYRLDADDSHAS